MVSASLFNQNSNRSNREKWSTSKGAPVFSVEPNRSIEFWTKFWLNGSRPWAFETGIPLTIGIRNFRRDPFNKNFRKFRSKTQWISSVQPEKCKKKLVHLLRWTTFPGRTGRNFGWMDRASSSADKWRNLESSTNVEFRIRDGLGLF